MADMIRKGYWVVLPYHLVRHLPNLRISPMGAVPQRERRPRIIMDYSFSNVNQEADKGAPPGGHAVRPGSQQGPPSHRDRGPGRRPGLPNET